MVYALSLQVTLLKGIFFPILGNFMGKQLCIIHANCQGDNLKGLLLSSPSFSNLFVIEKYTNYLHEEISENSLDKCGLFLYQHLGEQWGEHATTSLLQKLPASAQCICIPNMFFNGYWPLWTNKTHMAYGDILLEHLASSGLGVAEILHIYIKGKIRAKFDLDQLAQVSRTKEVEKEKHSHIKTLNIIDAHWREEQLFHTINHPGPRLTLHVANEILKLLSLSPVPAIVCDAYSTIEEEFIQPIHPQVGEYFQIPFATPNHLYNVYGQAMTFEQYARAYVQCRLQQGPDKIDDFVVFLHLLARQAQKTCMT